jgi:energy-coupling factor transporter ATP-binding protein EcfA2
MKKRVAATLSDSLAKAASKAGLSPGQLWAIRSWLAEQLVAQEYAKLGQGGHTNTQVPLRQVFVDLPIASSADTPSHSHNRTLFLKNLLAADPIDLAGHIRLRSENSAPHTTKEESDEKSELFDDGNDRAQNYPSRWSATLLIGGPGQGKSTLGQLACQLHRAALIRPASDELSSAQRDLVASFVPPTSGSTTGRELAHLGLPANPFLPLQVALPDFAAWISRNSIGDPVSGIPILLRFLADLPSAKAVGLEASQLLALLGAMPCLIVLDGFDEVGATQDRARIVAAARELLTALAENSGHTQILATTRPQGYADELSQLGVKLKKRYLSPLSREEALGYAEKLIQAKISGADQQARALRQIHEAAQEPATERLLTTPLQVTILTALVQHLGRAPRERWNLFSRYFAYTFDREIERDTYASPLLAEHRSHIERIHARVALLLQVEAERDGGASARMSRHRLEEVISDVLAEDEVAKSQSADLIHEIAAAAETRLVFLVEPEPGKFGFEIRSLQEFMAAWAITSGRDSEVEARLQQVSKAPMFRNVALFASSRLFSEGSPLRDVLADRICGGLDDDPHDELSRLSRSGALLALETLEEGAALSQPKRARSLMGRAVGLLSLPPGPEHVRLARVANDDTAPVLRLALESGLASAETKSSFCVAAAWVCLIDATNRRERWAIELADRYWDTSEGLFNELGRARVPFGEWICKKIEESAETISPESFIDAFSLYEIEGGTSSWASLLMSLYGPHGSWRYRDRSGVIPVGQASDRHDELNPTTRRAPSNFLWDRWVAITTFELHPSAENLAVALETLASGPKLSYWSPLQWRVLWPFAVCLASANESTDLFRYAALLREGVLGDTSDWILAERQWKSAFDPLAVLDGVVDDVPWTMESIAMAPPLMAIPIWRFVDRAQSKSRKVSRLEVVKKANLLFLRSHSGSLKSRLAEFCLAYWKNIATNTARALFDPAKWIECTSGGAALLIPRPKSTTVFEWKGLLDACDIDLAEPWTLSIEDILQPLLELPTHPILLKIAVRFIARHSDRFSHQELLPLDRVRAVVKMIQASPDLPIAIRADISTLQAFSGTHPPVEDHAIFEHVELAAKSDPEIWSSFVAALTTGGMPSERVNVLLGRAYVAMGVNHSAAKGAMKAIRDALQKRTSDLDSRATWDRLALPMPYPQQPPQAKLEGRIPQSPVRIESVELKDIGAFKKVALDLKSPPPGAGQWTVIIGPNGVGKTTLLRSVALALRSVKFPSIWPKGAFSGSWQRLGVSGEPDTFESSIVVRLGDGIEHRTLIRPSTLGIAQLPEQDHPQLMPIFAYGCRRGSALGGVARQVNLEEDDGPEIATLFDEGADLIHAETWLVALEGDTTKNPASKAIFESVVLALKALMNLDFLEVSGQRLWAAEAGGVKVPFSYLSDGYLTSAGWFLDLIARWLKLAERRGLGVRGDFLSQMRGLVLIDEIDLHLHPRWQIEIISRTRALLPEMSFIVTTHNPLTLVGAKAEEIWILEKKDDELTVSSGVETPMLLTGGQIYRQYFGIGDIYPSALGRLLQRYSFLSGYALRDDGEQKELETVGRQLAAAGLDPGWEVIPQAGQSSEKP